LLDRATYLPVVIAAWNGMMKCVTSAGLAGLFVVGQRLLQDLHSPADRISGVEVPHLAVDGAKK
jgi:hypothetical protein